MEWIDIKKYLPGDLDWKIVRTINSDYTEFFFMAHYDCGKWGFFDEKYEEKGRMQVTHWCAPDRVTTTHKWEG